MLKTEIAFSYSHQSLCRPYLSLSLSMYLLLFLFVSVFGVFPSVSSLFPSSSFYVSLSLSLTLSLSLSFSFILFFSFLALSPFCYLQSLSVLLYLSLYLSSASPPPLSLPPLHLPSVSLPFFPFYNWAYVSILSLFPSVSPLCLPSPSLMYRLSLCPFASVSLQMSLSLSPCLSPVSSQPLHCFSSFA